MGIESKEKEPHPCVFCDILKEKKESSLIAENPSAIAIISLEGYPLVIPRTHITLKNLHENVKEMSESFELATSLVKATMQALNASGVNIIANLGKSAGQHFPHTHIHVINRNTNDGQVKFSPIEELPREVLEKRAYTIKKAFNR